MSEILKRDRPLAVALRLFSTAFVLIMTLDVSELKASPQRPYIHEMFGPEMVLSWPEGQRLHEEAMDLYYAGQYVAALQILERGISEAARIFGAQGRDAAILLTTKAQGILLLGNIKEAATLLDKALIAASAAVMSDHPVVGRIEFARAAALLLGGDLVGMKAAAERANACFARSADGVPQGMALRVLAVMSLATGDLSKASNTLAESSRIIVNAMGNGSLLHAENQIIEAAVATARGEYGNAVRLCEIGLQTLTACLGSEHLMLLNARNLLADNYQMLGLYGKALPLLEANLRAAEITLGTESFVLSTILNSFGLLQYRLGNFTDAEHMLRRCLSLRSLNLGAESSAYAATLNNLALVLQAAGKTEEVSKLYLDASRTLDKSLGTNSPTLAVTLLNWGNFSRHIGNLESASNLIGEALSINDRAFGKDHPATADALEALAQLKRDAGDFSHAIHLANLSYSIRLKLYGDEHLAVADSLSTQASLHARMGDPFTAAELHGKSALTRTTILGLDHPSVASELETAGSLLAGSGEFDFAVNVFALSLQSQKNYLVSQFARTEDSSGFELSKRAQYRIELFHSLAAAALSDTRAFAGTAAEQLAVSKALMEEVEVAKASLDVDSGFATREMRAKISQTRNQFEKLSVAGLTPTQRDAKRQHLQRELSQSEEALSSFNDLVAQTVQTKGISLAVIAQALAPHSAHADIVRYRRYDFLATTNRWKEHRYAAYLTFPLAEGSTNVVVERVDLGEVAPIDEAVAVVSRRMSAGQYRARDLATAMDDLSRLVYAPLARHLTNVSHLIVCPDGELNRLPFEMLRHDGRYLIEHKTISYVTSGREIAWLAQPRDPRQSSAPLVMGNPDFDFDLGGNRREEVQTLNAERGIQNGELSQSLLTSAPTRYLSRDFRGGVRFTPLPGSEIEATNVARFLGDEAILRIGPEAREADLKLVVSPRVLHLATHGFFLADQERKHSDRMDAPLVLAADRPWKASGGDWENPMVRCGLALAGANHAGTITNAIAEDGILTGLEAALLNLQGTELVILSACDSGTGEVKIGEGVMSLRRAFRIAGAGTVLASHWPVSDQATSRLMTEFMRRWQAGESRSAAWRQAQLALLQSENAKDDFSDPYFWAAFTLTGQWRN